MYWKVWFFISICVSSALAATSTVATSSIQGTLTAQDGTTVKSAKITANFSAPARDTLGPVVTGLLQASAVTAADGSFSLSKLLPGTYTLCAQAAFSGQIDPCHWSQTPPQVTVLAGQVVTGFKISLKKGSILNIRVDDPKHFLSAASSVPGIPHILAGVYTPGGQFYPVLLAGKDATGSNYRLTVPLNTTLRFTIASKHVRLVDSKGNAVPANGLTYSFRHDSSIDNSAPVEFLITASN